MLASRARKYGLGLLFATQAPKGLHSQIPVNAATQFFGLMNAPMHIEAAREMARFNGGDVPDIARLTSGEFYVAIEGHPFREVRTPLCLTHRPPRSPPRQYSHGQFESTRPHPATLTRRIDGGRRGAEPR